MRNMKRKHLFVGIIAAVFLFSAAVLQADAQNWQIVPGRSVGAINANTSEKELIKIYGRANVRRMAIDVGEGETLPGTVLFPGDPRRKLSILWRDPATRLRPESISITSKTTLWKTDRGITIGTPLTTIEKLNGRAFALTGFAWDYEGTVLHANGGLLTELGTLAGEDITGRTLLLRVAPSAAMRTRPEYERVLGDGSFLSDNADMRKLDPRVYEMTVTFPD